jgi:protein O-GlcNAc transferase
MVSKSDRETAQEHLSYGKVYLDQNEMEHAIDEFQLALSHDPENIVALTELGKAQLAKKQYEEAVGVLDRALAIEPQYADLHYYLGCACMESGRKERAINEFKEALNINPRYAAARNTLGHIMKTMQRMAQGREENAHGDDLNESRQANVHFHLGNALMQKNLLQEALIEFKEAVRLRPNYPDIRNKIGELYMRRGLFNLAEEEFLTCLKLNPKFITALLNLAETYRQHSENLLDKAESTYQKLLDIDPDNHDAQSGLEKVQHIKSIDFV